MNEQINVGDKAKMLIGPQWHQCTVVAIDDIPHWSGNSIRRYTCSFKGGDLICCGRNSIKHVNTKESRTSAGLRSARVQT